MMDDLYKTERVSAGIDAVWAAWTTDGGVRGFFAPESHVDAVEGGAYELYFALDLPAGERGSEGCTLVALDRPRRLEFTWNFPPSLPTLRDLHTNVVVELREDDGETAVTLRQTGFLDGEDWSEGRAYFERAWGLVLRRLRQRFEQGPIDWEHL
jgi:uncharacterized protein YndB with AHSA1/START domain